MTATGSGDGGMPDALGALLESGSGKEDLARGLFGLAVAETRLDEPELADLMRSLALPRGIDADVIGALRGQPWDTEENERLLGLLPGFGFVLTRREGGLVYHDRTREALLAEWLSAEDDADSAEFERLNKLLADLHLERSERGEAVRADLQRVAPLMLEANSDRYARLVSDARASILRPLTEALYHRTLVSAELGLDLFLDAAGRLEDEGDAAACLSLIEAQRQTLDGLPDPDEPERWLGWLSYWEIRVRRVLGMEAARALEAISELLGRTGDDSKLRSWTLLMMGDARYDVDDHAGARDAYEESLGLASADPWNRSVIHAALARISYTLDDPADAVEHYEASLEAATETGNLRSRCLTLLSLSEALDASDRRTDARDRLFEALEVGRTDVREDPVVQQNLTGRLSDFYTPHDPALAQTAHREALSLWPEEGAKQRLWHVLAYSWALRLAGAHERASDLLQQVREGVQEADDKAMWWEWRYRAAAVAADAGDAGRAIELASELIDDIGSVDATRWNRSTALLLRARGHMARGNWAAAEEDARVAKKLRLEIGHVRVGPVVDVLLARMAHKQGKLTEALDLLDAARPELEPAPGYLTDEASARGTVLRDLERRPEAAIAFERGLAASLSMGDLVEAASAALELARLYALDRNWATSTLYAGQSAKLARALGSIATHADTAETLAADTANADGLQGLMESDVSLGSLRRAREAFRAAATGPGANAQHRLNLAYACRQLGEWSDAADALEAALRSMPPGLRSPVLERQVAELRVAHAEGLLDASRYEGALRELGATLDTARSLLPPVRMAGVWLRFGDAHLGRGEVDDAAAAYTSALELLEPAGEPEAARLRGRLARTAASKGESVPVLRMLREALLATDELPAAEAVVDGFLELIMTRDQATLAAEVLRALSRDRALSSQARRVAARGLFTAVSLPAHGAEERVFATYGLGAGPTEPALTLRAHPSLFPDEDEALRDRVISVELPAMRERIRAATGVTMPAIQIQPVESELLDDEYRLLVWDVEMFRSRVPDAPPDAEPDAEGDRYTALFAELERAIAACLGEALLVDDLLEVAGESLADSDENAVLTARLLRAQLEGGGRVEVPAPAEAP